MQHTFSKLAIAGAAFVMIVGLTVLMPGQEAPQARQAIAVGRVQVNGMPEDWTHHNVIFSNPGTEEDAIQNATYVEWLKLVNEPRYILHTLRQHLPAQGPAAENIARFQEMAVSRAQATTNSNATLKTPKPPIVVVKPPVNGAKPKMHHDWSVLLGASGATVGAGNYPAKYSFSISATPLCGNAGTPDYAVYNTSLAGSSTQASIVAYDNLYASCSGQVPSDYWAFNTGGAVVTSVVLSLDGSQLVFVQTPASGSAQLVLLKWAATPTGHTLTSGSTNITSGSKAFTVTSGLSYLDVGAQISGTGIPAGDTIATWTSATAGTLYTAATGNGTSGETLTITADAGSPDTLTAVSNGSYSGCTAPCMTTLTFSGSGTVTDTLSSPYVDYSNNIVYVGDSSGHLHKFINIFNGATPAEVTSAPWPVAVSANILTSPVHDPSSGNIYVADSGGFLYAYNASGTKVMDSSQLAINAGGIVQGPLVDSSTGKVYAFVGRDGSTALTSACGAGSYGSGCSSVFQFSTSNTSTGNTGTICSQYGTTSYPTSWTTGTNCGSEKIFGEQNGGPNLVYTGAFDHIYYTGSGNTGNLWTCSTTIYQTASCSGANSANTCNNTKLVYVPMTSAWPAVDWGDTAFYSLTDTTTANPAYCTPTTESYGAGGSTNDYVFVGATLGGSRTGTDCYIGGTGSDGGCLYSFLVSSNGTTTIVPNGATDGINAYGGPSGVIIDNTSGATGASQIYYSPVGYPTTGQNDSGGSGIPPTCPEVNGTILVGCAVQASQLALE
jgi:hypothetical protein